MNSSKCALACAALSFYLGACSGSSSSQLPPDDAGPQDGSASGGGQRDGGNGGNPPPVSCTSRCTAIARACGKDGASCAQLCTTLTESQLQCLERAACDTTAARACLATVDPDNGPYTNKPDKLTISGAYGRDTPTHLTSSDGKRVTSFASLEVTPRFKPSTPSEMPDLRRGIQDITRPARGTCQARFVWKLDADKISVNFDGEDVLPATACADFADNMAATGIDAVFSDVPYPNGGTASTVTVNIVP